MKENIKKGNGYGKEYDHFGRLIYEGGFANGKRHGNGKTFNVGNIEFEGEFYKGRKWNGKGYDKQGNLVYELINGHGKILEYDEYGLKFEGQYLNGMKNGFGKIYSHGSMTFEGEFKDDRINGKGKEYSYGELRFEGEYLNGRKYGKVKEYSMGRLLYEGNYVNDNRLVSKISAAHLNKK